MCSFLKYIATEKGKGKCTYSSNRLESFYVEGCAILDLIGSFHAVGIGTSVLRPSTRSSGAKCLKHSCALPFHFDALYVERKNAFNVADNAHSRSTYLYDSSHTHLHT